MSINGIGPAGAGLGGITPWRTPGEGEAAREPRKAPAAPASGSESRETRQAQALREVPAGVDPQLWGVLTSEERAFMLRAREMGPVTYRPGAPEGRGEAPIRGGRLDVRV
jgi:hypothetical protein